MSARLAETKYRPPSPTSCAAKNHSPCCDLRPIERSPTHRTSRPLIPPDRERLSPEIPFRCYSETASVGRISEAPCAVASRRHGSDNDVRLLPAPTNPAGSSSAEVQSKWGPRESDPSPSARTLARGGLLRWRMALRLCALRLRCAGNEAGGIFRAFQPCGLLRPRHWVPRIRC